MDINKILAKSNGITLIEHSKEVSRVASLICKNILNFDDETIMEAVRIGALTHDIGKCTNQFQKSLKNDKLDESDKDYKLPFRHNEIGWSFLRQHLLCKKDILSYVLDSVYWHHGISNKMSSYDDSKIELLDSEIDLMKSLLTHLGLDINEKPKKSKKAPKYYVTNDEDDCDEINMYNTFIRTCIISADRLVSSINTKLFSDELLISIHLSNLREGEIDFTKHPYFGGDRFTKQINISEEINLTTSINAPAGFGKTIVGLLGWYKSGKKLLWVCPRNIIAESVYEDILKEIDACGDHNISIELYIGGETVKHNEYYNKEFGSDIIITNIDNFLTPSVDNRKSHKLFSILDYYVVFDEYHEFPSDAALFACFINILSVRNKLTNSTSVLLTATPININHLWESHNRKTKFLPSKGEHYGAQHTTKYLINSHNEFDVKDLNGNNLIILNSIVNSQIKTVELKSELLIHSQFTNNDKQNIMKSVLDNYGEGNNSDFGKPNLVGTHIIQASLNVSFGNLYESVLSPQTTLQRVGRCDRFGKYNNPTINIINFCNKSEISVRNMLYSNNLSNIWFECINNFNGVKLTLDELYLIYNKHENKNEKVLKSFFDNLYYASLDKLSNIHPVKYYDVKQGKSEIITAGSNKLRSNNNEVFVICKIHDSKDYIDPVSVNVYSSFGDDFNEVGNIQNKLLKTMKHLRNNNDVRFDFNNILNNKKINIDNIRALSKKSNTPYIRFDKVYDTKFGIISEDLLINLKNDLLNT